MVGLVVCRLRNRDQLKIGAVFWSMLCAAANNPHLVSPNTRVDQFFCRFTIGLLLGRVSVFALMLK